MNFLYCFLILSFLNFTLGPYLYKLSLDLMHYIQAEGRDPTLLSLFTSLKMIAENQFFYMITLLLFVFASKAFALHYTLITSVTMFTFVYLKMLFREPRPYQYDPTI